MNPSLTFRCGKWRQLEAWRASLAGGPGALRHGDPACPCL